ncbi:MAG: type 4a pilus biogenesis protein PilO [bacterium]|nr:type 4a pilus biogenesis protein PilO [bacterium]
MKIQKDLLKNFSTGKYLKNLPNFQEEKTRSITTLVLTLVALSAFGLFAISPTLSTIAQLQKQLDDNRLVYEKLEQKIANLELLQRQYNLIEKDVPLVLAAVPQTPNTSRLVGQLQAISLSSAVKITKIQVFQVELSQSKAPDNPSFIFSIGVDGPSENVSKFLLSLSDFDRIVAIDILSINKQGEKGITQLQLRGKAYYER